MAHQRGPVPSITRSVWLWQLIPAALVLLATLLAFILGIDNLLSTSYWIGALAIMAISLTVLGIPWHRISRRWILVLPLLDIVAIGMLTLNSQLRFSALWIIPVAWISLFFAPPWALVSVIMIGGFLTVSPFMAETGATTEPDVLRAMVLTLAFAFVAAALTTLARRLRSLRTLLATQAARLRRALARTTVQSRRTVEMLNGLHLAVALVDEEAEVLMANDAYRDLYGRDQERLGDPRQAVEYAQQGGRALVDDERPLVRAAAGETTSDERLWLFGRDGTWRAMDLSIHQLSRSREERGVAIVALRDVSELLDANTKRESMAMLVSHELRNPLTAILGHVDLMLARSDLSVPVTRHAKAIEDAGERLLVLVDSVLGSADTSSPLSCERFDLADLAKVSTRSFWPAARSAQLSLIEECSEPVWVVGDAFRVRQALDNLVSNAVKYTRPGGTIRVIAGAVDVGLADDRPLGDDVTRAAYVAVADTGYGIPPEELDHVFETRFRARDARDSAVQGTGLGLGIAREIARVNAGEITVSSTPGVGTRATLWLPCDEQLDPEVVASGDGGEGLT